MQGGKGVQIVIRPALALLACALMAGHPADTVHLVASGAACKSGVQWRGGRQVEPDIRVCLSQMLAELAEGLEGVCLAFARCKRTDRQIIRHTRAEQGFLELNRVGVAEFVCRVVASGAFPSPSPAAVPLTGEW